MLKLSEAQGAFIINARECKGATKAQAFWTSSWRKHITCNLFAVGKKSEYLKLVKTGVFYSNRGISQTFENINTKKFVVNPVGKGESSYVTKAKDGNQKTNKKKNKKEQKKKKKLKNKKKRKIK